MSAALCMLSQACVQYCPAAAFAPEPPQPPAYQPQDAAAPVVQPAPQAAGQDDAIVAPIALYPDPLIALILPAATVPADMIAASSYLIQYGDATRLGSQPWDPSVRALAHYPTVVTWMVENMPWTQALGYAFISSPADVMDAIQRLRARALASGALTSTPQQQVYSDGGEIEIYPAQPDSVYVPVYDDSVVYSDDVYDGYGGPFINFGSPYPAGIWLSYYFDWGRHRVWSGDQNVWREHKGWQPPRTGGDRAPPGAHPWHPPLTAPRNFQPENAARGNGAPVPRPMQGAPSPPPDRFRKPAIPQGLSPQASSQLPLHATAAPQGVQPRSVGAGTSPVSGEAHRPSIDEPRPVPPPAPVPAYTTAPARGSEPAATHSAPVHTSAPAPAPAQNASNQQPQK